MEFFNRIGRVLPVAAPCQPYRQRPLCITHRSVAAATTADSPKAATAKNYAPWPAHDPKKTTAADRFVATKMQATLVCSLGSCERSLVQEGARRYLIRLQRTTACGQTSTPGASCGPERG
ncbi:hypothetical protein SBA1_930005 [Candidatus Sulfotelmatobacter kueseliae]|uniref:Uncharacterized protein n=1 Tax=Candidatus Sulfotelmatobacter kueseliae TaxID=2042962 RepID=A0A2U3LCV8_9BACT|nr:hypothetical protein SBA1_930005 [Candidatus Sulfotelmatobacter kueseliae]